MIPDNRDVVLLLLREELQGYLAWLVEELGEDYYIVDMGRASESLEEESLAALNRRARSERSHLWDRDYYAFHHHEKHPSIYKVLEAADLEILHYPAEFSCEHYRALDAGGEETMTGRNLEKQYEQSFGVLLASQALGYMYRLDFCEFCGLVEIWSMEYDPREISLFSETA